MYIWKSKVALYGASFLPYTLGILQLEGITRGRSISLNAHIIERGVVPFFGMLSFGLF